MPGELLASGGKDLSLRIYDTQTKQVSAVPLCHSGTLNVILALSRLKAVLATAQAWLVHGPLD